ncbi:MAG: hypothetical protein E5X67_32885 [Mesorhizobium sp.]|uniref:AAA family ATPase n=1 Tax=Mesorhizobium sp. TaxID=1871066 RepID=UPI001206AE47|nr:AAA family ATPase [Mesorhizobium sp.]TIP23529.1 MAG: hypothetical protein E5X67_32885 [Mesorhizobium sp.]
MTPSYTKSAESAQALSSTNVEVSANENDLSDLLGPDPLPSIGTNLGAALYIAKRGFAVFPCREIAGLDYKGQPADVKSPYTRNGFKDATDDAAQIRQWWRQWPDALPALPTGERNGFSVLDLDRHDANEDGIAALQSLGFNPDTLSAFSVTSGSGGQHIYLQHAPGITNADSHLPAGINVRGQGGYVIAPGAVLPDGRRYQARGTLDLAKLPAWPAALLAPARAERDRDDLSDLLGPDPLPVNWNEVTRALDHIDPGCSRDEWIRVGMALHAASDGNQEAFELWDGWSAGATEPGKYNDRIMRGQWRSFSRREGIDIGTLFHIAGEYGWTRASLVDADDFDDLLESPKPKSGAAPSRLAFLTPADCEAAPSRGYLIKGLFAPGDVACIFGAPGAGKSLLAPHLGYAVAQGTETFGMRCKQGRVFYVAAEDPHGMRGRIKALRKARGEAEDIQLVEGVSNLLADKSPDLVALVAAVKEKRPALIFIDTLAMAFPGLEENDAKSMGRVVAVARHLAQWGAAVVLIHHDTKAEGATPRGHSLLNGALDVALHVKRDEAGVIRGKLTKNRNGTCERDIAFKIAVETGGIDEDGDTITLPRCLELKSSPVKSERLSPSVKAALVCLEGLGGTATEKAWRDACADGRSVSASDERESRVKAFKRAVEHLVRSSHVEFGSGLYRIPDGFDQDGDET